MDLPDDRSAFITEYQDHLTPRQQAAFARQCPPAASGAPTCLARQCDLVCTREQGHQGAHVAYGDNAGRLYALAAWPR